MTPPCVVLPPDGDLAAAARQAARDGWTVHSGFAGPAEPWDLGSVSWVGAGPVLSASDAQAALLLAVRGAGLIVAVDEDASWAAGFLADLRRLAPPASAPPAVPLSDDQRALLDLLADGRSIPEAARALFVSLRTANRRLADARAALNARTTSEAVVTYRRLTMNS